MTDSSPSKNGFYDRFVTMWHDLISSPIKHTQRYENVSEMFKEVDAEIERLQQKLTAAEQLAVRQGNEIRKLRAGERA